MIDLPSFLARFSTPVKFGSLLPARSEETKSLFLEAVGLLLRHGILVQMTSYLYCAITPTQDDYQVSSSTLSLHRQGYQRKIILPSHAKYNQLQLVEQRVKEREEGVGTLFLRYVSV